MGLIKRVTSWSYDELLDYLSVNPTRDEVTHYKLDPHDGSDNSIMKMNAVKDFGSITCLDYSESEMGVVGVGEKNGFIRLFNILINEDSQLDSFDIKARAKQMRCINTLGLNTNGLIAMGLDRNRADPSLQIWDINYQSTESEVINPTFAYCVNESIVSLKFLNDTSVLAASTKFLKEIDVRSTNAVYQLPTRLSYDIKLNPFNEYQFSTYGDDGTLAIWDRRKLAAHDAFNNDLTLPQPLITFEKLVGTGAASRKYMNSCFRWSPLSGQEFATLHRGDTIKRWRLGSYSEGDNINFEKENLFVSTVHDISTTYDRVVTFDYVPQDNRRSSLICMRQSGTVYRMPINQSYSRAVFDSYNSLVLSNREVPEIEEIKVTEGVQKSSLTSVAKRLQNLSFEDLDIGDENTQENRSENVEDEDMDVLEPENTEHADQNETEKHSLDSEEGYEIYWKPEKLLQKDISVIMRIRASLGYGLDPMTTVDMIDRSKNLQNNSYIRNTWRWIAIAKASIEEGTMVSGNLDLGYEGVLGIWNGFSGISTQKRYRHEIILNDKQLNKEMEKIIKARARQKASMGYKNPISRWPDSPKQIQRKLCLIISGWHLSPTDYEEKYQKIIGAGSYEKAAAWAVFFGDIPKAVEILSSAKKERLTLIATAISGYMAYKDQPGNNAWRQQCRKMSSELDDPYLRVIFAFIADNDWWDILYEPAISLRERLGVALRFLNDLDLSRFLERTSSMVIQNGELEGLILTGITPSGIDLLQSYVNKTSDVQTAALISIFGSPRYFRDKRVDEWVQVYRNMLNSWELFSMRAKFDVLRTKLSRTSRGEITAKIKPRQLYLQCLKCKQNASKVPADLLSVDANLGDRMRPKDYSSSKNHNTPHPGDTSNKKYVCQHCGTPFPRCAICLLPLGTSNLPFIINGVSTGKTGNTKINDDTSTSFSASASGIKGSSRSEPAVPDTPTNKSTATKDIDESALQQRRNAELSNKRKQKLNEWFAFCLSCNHGMHAGHADEWFARHSVCPVPGCSCQCSKL